MNFTRLNPPETLPATDAQIDAHLRVGMGNDGKLDAHASRCVLAATREIEDHAGIALFRQEIQVYSTGRGPVMNLVSKGCGYRLPIGPALKDQPSSVLIVAADGTEHTLTASQYAIWGGPRAMVHIHDDGHLPDAVRHVFGRLIVTYWAGFAETVDDVPADLRHAILDQASLYLDAGYDLRRGHNGLSPHTARIAARYRRVGFD